MPGPRRGALPLALLIGAVLVAGIVFAVVRQPEREDRAEPTPTASPPETPTTPPEDETPPPEDETPPPDDETPPPDDETPPPDDETPPPDDETPPPGDDGPGVAGPGRVQPPADRRPLAETGGPVVPFLGVGAALVALSAALWRFSRPPAD